MEQDERDDGEHSPGPLSNHTDTKDTNYKPASEEEISQGDDAFIVPKKPLEQKRLHQRLIATARSLKKQKQRLKAAQDTLNDRWNEVLDTEEQYDGNRQTKSYPKQKLLPEFDDEAIAPYRQKIIRPTNRTDHLVVKIERLAMPYTSPHPLPVKEERLRLGPKNTIYVRT